MSKICGGKISVHFSYFMHFDSTKSSTQLKIILFLVWCNLIKIHIKYWFVCWWFDIGIGTPGASSWSSWIFSVRAIIYQTPTSGSFCLVVEPIIGTDCCGFEKSEFCAKCRTWCGFCVPCVFGRGACCRFTEFLEGIVIRVVEIIGFYCRCCCTSSGWLWSGCLYSSDWCAGGSGWCCRRRCIPILIIIILITI